ncbi:hypothetical protein SprV_0802607800 [Sparganum proliferum]
MVRLPSPGFPGLEFGDASFSRLLKPLPFYLLPPPPPQFVVVPLPEHILQSLREAETRGTESSSEDEGDDDEEEEDDDGYEEDDLDEEMDEDEEDAEDSVESKPRIDIEKLSEYVARA